MLNVDYFVQHSFTGIHFISKSEIPEEKKNICNFKVFDLILLRLNFATYKA